MEFMIAIAGEARAYGEVCFNTTDELVKYIAANGGRAKVELDTESGLWVIELPMADESTK